MPSVLCLGAGLVTAPGVKYMCQHGIEVTVASRTVSKAEEIVAGLANGKAVAVDVTQEADLPKLEELIGSHDLIISLLPWTQHLPIAKLAIKHKKHFATTSYIADEMQALHEQFASNGLISLNEIGVDPGLDHMSAVKIIDEVTAAGGQVESFTSYCGGLPCPDDNTNPFGYKFSWSPRGVLLAAIRQAVYLAGGDVKKLDGSQGKTIYDAAIHDTSVPNVGTEIKTEWPSAFECHPNGDSVKYIPFYKLQGVTTLIRGTYRNVGWCPTMKKVTELGMLKEDDVSAFVGKSYAELMAHKLGSEVGTVKAALAAKAGLAVDDPIIARLEWLGLISADKVVKQRTSLDALCDLFLENPKFWYQPGERDMLVMHHTFVVRTQSGERQQITSTMVDYGIANGDTSMSRTVSLPLAIAVRKIFAGEFKMVGVVRPTTADIYVPILDEMERDFGVVFHEKTTPL